MQGQNKDVKLWYVLRLPKSDSNISNELEAEMERRKRKQLPEIEYFAPTFIDVSENEGIVKRSSKPLCLNYVFLRTTIIEIRRFRQSNPNYNLIKSGDDGSYMTVPENEMRMFMTIALAYKDVIPCYSPDEVNLSKGDRVKIIGGKFAGVEGILITQQGKDGGRVILNVCNQFSVSTLSIEPEYLRILSFSPDNKHIYKKLDSYYPKIRKAMLHFVSSGGLDDTDRASVKFFLLRFGEIHGLPAKIRSKYICFLMISHTLLGHSDESKLYSEKCIACLPDVTNQTTLAFILSSLYICTGNNLYATQMRALMSKWQSEKSLSAKQRDIMSDWKVYLSYNTCP